MAIDLLSNVAMTNCKSSRTGSRICGAVAGLLLYGFLCDGRARAQAEDPPQTEGPPAAEQRSRALEVEVDPTFFFLHGFLTQVAVKPGTEGFAAHLRIAAGFVTWEHPQFLIDMNEDNEGWSVNIPWGVATDLTYLFGDRQRGFLAGVVVLLRREEYSPPSGVGETAIRNLSAIPYIGYQWFPFDGGWARGLYLMPRLGAFVLIHTSDEAVVGGEEFEQSAVLPAAAVHVGYSFRF